jgi:uncharacterized protein Smg (DUF494 family)
MSDDRERAAVQRLLGLLAEHLEDFFDGNELALERLGVALEQGDFSGDDLQAAVLTLRSLAGERFGAPAAALDVKPGRLAQRVLSEQERDSLSPEAWGHLLDLRRRGALSAEQFERVIDRLASSGVRPVNVEMAHQVALRIAMAGAGISLDGGMGETDVAH